MAIGKIFDCIIVYNSILCIYSFIIYLPVKKINQSELKKSFEKNVHFFI